MSKNCKAHIGIFGGSGFYNLLKNARQISIKTKYGKPSDKITIGEFAGQKIAFLPRHGSKHNFPPHKIPYKANLAAFKKLGVKHIIAPCSAGSLQSHIKPGEFVILDQFVDRTYGRDDTIFHGPQVTHFSMNEPYCPSLRKLTSDCCKKLKISHHKNGTAVVVQGPRFSTIPESRWFSSLGWEVVNMTQYPECYLAREMGMCYVGIALITDYDVGLKNRPNIKPVTIKKVIKTFSENNERVKKLIFEMIDKISKKEICLLCKNEIKKALI